VAEATREGCIGGEKRLDFGSGPPVRPHLRQDGAELARGHGPLREGGEAGPAEFTQEKAERIRFQAGRIRRRSEQGAG
jgi:hypothetical protein